MDYNDHSKFSIDGKDLLAFFFYLICNSNFMFLVKKKLFKKAKFKIAWLIDYSS